MSVGDSIRPVMRKYKGQLVESPPGDRGAGALPGRARYPPALTFAMVYRGNRIVEISGGAVVQPDGE